MWWYLIFYLLGNETQTPLAPLKHRKASVFEIESVVKGCNQFAFDVHRQLQLSDGNVFFSPYSICTAFSMVLLGSKGNTEKQLRNTFHFDKDLDVHTVFSKLATDLKVHAARNYTLKTANRLFISKYFGVSPAYQQQLQHYYTITTESLEFGTGEAEGIINQWVADQTNNLIPELLPIGSLEEDTQLVLANAVYFKGSWAKQFRKESTKIKKFQLFNGKVVGVDMMRQEGFFRYRSDAELNANVLQLPYNGDRVVMLIVLPNHVFGLPTMMKQLTAEKIRQLMEGRKTEVDVQLPKFKLEKETKLKEILKELYLTDIFEDSSDLSGMSDEHLKISKIKHKAFVQVDEEGTEAAAATAVVAVGRSLTYPERFICDHPFYFAIFDDVTKIIFFSGVIVEPKTG